jgi:PAS domain S-box-containing protein
MSQIAELTHGDYVPVVEAMPEMVWLGDVNGKCVYLNRALRAFWGVAVEDLPRFSWGGTLLAEDHEMVSRIAGAATAAARPFTLRARYRRADGAVRVLETRAEPRFAPNGEFMGMVGINTDVTDA